MSFQSTVRSTTSGGLLEPFKINRPQRQSTMPVPPSGNASASVLHLLSGEIGCFSRDDEGQFVDDSSQRRIYSPPKDLTAVNWDLNHGYEKWICRDNSSDDSFEMLLKWLSDSSAAANVLANDGRSTVTADDQPQQTPRTAVLVCCRSLITRMLTTPYQENAKSNGWKAAICRYNGVLYANDWNIRANEDGSYDPKRDMYRGFKFETYITAANKESKPDIEAPVNNNRSLLSVVKTSLGGHTFVHMADVDCYDAATDKPIELKTCPQLLSDDRRLKNFKRYKMMKWWAQCVLNETEKVVCGFKNENSVVTKLHEYKVSTLPDEAAKGLGNAAWKVDECYKFCSEFMDYVKRTVTEDYNKTIYVFTYNDPHIENSRDQVICKTAATNCEDAPLPSWFTRDNVHCRKTAAAQAQIRS